MSPSHRCRAYGLRIASSFRLPELPASDSPAADVEVREARLGAPPPGPVPPTGRFWRRGAQLWMHWEDVGTFCVQGGTRILVDPLPGAEERRVRLFLLGAALGALLHQRGTPVFHASAVELAGRAVAFLGGKGRGKSTLAAVLVGRGHRLLTDDVLALDVSDPASPAVLPAFPQLKLWPDALDYLGEDAGTLPRISSRIEKRDRTLDGEFAARPVPLHRVYLLGRGSGPHDCEVSPGDAILALQKNAYANRFGREIIAAEEPALFRACSRIAAAVETRQLLRPSDLDLMPAAADVIEAACS